MSKPEQEARHQAIVLIDEAEPLRRLLEKRLKSARASVHCADDPQGAIDLIKKYAPDVVVLGLDRMDDSGYEMLRQIKETPETKDVHVMVISGMSNPQDKVAAFDLGAADYITKPFDMLELRVRVRVALQSRELVRMLGEQAQIDGLSGAYNRAHFDARLGELISGAERNRHVFSLAIFDLDKFKSINDTYGHPAGDAVIKGMAKLIRAECRTCDVPCRYGGEEFALLMPDTTPAQAVVVCERVRVKLSEMRWPHHPERQVTVSIGISGLTAGESVPDAATMIAAADKCLYQSKEGGRDQVTASLVDGTPVSAGEAAAAA